LNTIIEFLNYISEDTTFINALDTEYKKFKPILISQIEEHYTDEIFYIVNSGGKKDEEINKFNAFFIDFDCPKTMDNAYATLEEVAKFKEAILRKIASFALLPTFIIDTRNGYHIYWCLKRNNNIKKDDWKKIEKHIVNTLNSDPKVCNPARNMRVPFTYWNKDKSNPYYVGIHTFNDIRYSIEEICSAFKYISNQTCLKQELHNPQKQIKEANFHINDKIDAISKLDVPRMKALIQNSDGLIKNENKNIFTLQELYSEIVANEVRNQLIVMDVLNSYKNGRNCVVLTERTAHVENIAKMLKEKINDVICLTGGMNAKESRETMKRIADTPKDKSLVLVATGRYIGEGFDEPRLDTLFLAMPISWKGTLQQYAGRLHRLFETKKEVQIYDYVDIHVKMLEKMYNRRLSGYASIGYKAKGESIGNETINVIFDKSNFLPVYTNDLVNAKREIIIVSPFISKIRTVQMIQYLDIAVQNKIRIVVVTRPVEDFGHKDIVALQGVLDLLRDASINIVFKTNIHQKFAIIDERIVWYGSINLLSFGSAEESIMRLESSNIASELIRSIEK
jgi:hypothetical protein